MPFTSETRYMITANRINDHKRAHLKGAPQIVLKKCSHLFLNGKQVPLSAGDREDILARNEDYILTSNVPEIVPFLLFVLFGWPLALPVLLILCIDLGTDMLPAVGLGMEPSSPDIMNLKPRDPQEKLLNWKMLARSYGFIGPLQTLFAYLIFFDILLTGGWSWDQKLNIDDSLYISAVTAFFSSVVVTQIFNVFACRTRRTSVFSKFLPNRVILIGIVAEILMILLLAHLPPFRTLLGTAPFPTYYYGWMAGFGTLVLLGEEGRKYLNRRFGLFELTL
ncbi:MAG: Calcium-transporting ATPase [Syntrophus sp. PtaU1.Bin208]|nr:MAG: Calcium-transporting ATPase [Syntrophus sp. PtaU1.Bin208]